MHCKPLNYISRNIYEIFLQVILIFIFLTFFFFTYVTKIEKETFDEQMNIVVDDLLDDVDIKQIIPEKDREAAPIILYGVLDESRDKLISATKDANASIKHNNDIIKNKSMALIIITIASIILSSSIILLLNYCIDFKGIFKYMIITVFFVALTELTFLLLITKKFRSVDPSIVRKHIGTSIDDWLKKRKDSGKD